MNYWLVTRRTRTLVLIQAVALVAVWSAFITAVHHYTGRVPLWIFIATFGTQAAITQYAAFIRRKRRRLRERIARSRSRNALR